MKSFFVHPSAYVRAMKELYRKRQVRTDWMIKAAEAVHAREEFNRDACFGASEGTEERLEVRE